MIKNISILIVMFVVVGCGGSAEEGGGESGKPHVRNDSAYKLEIDLEGSLQNPAMESLMSQREHQFG